MTDKKRKGMVFGTFDGLHPGHLYFLKKAREFCDELIVVVARDEIVRKIKRRAPRSPLSERFSEIKKSGLADKIVSGDKEQGSWNIMRKYRPDTVILGYDQRELAISLRTAFSYFPFSFDIVVLDAHHPEKFKSSLINR